MNNPTQDRRQEERFKVGGSAVLRSETGSESYPATVLNVSGAGLYLGLESTHPFQVGDDVVCEIKLSKEPGHRQQPFAAWGMGKVVRIDSNGAAIELHTAMFESDH